MSSLSRQQLEVWLSKVDVKGDVLDIGGGQKSLEGRVRSHEPRIYIVMDNDKGFNPDVNWDVCIPKKFSELFPMLTRKFDQIFCLEVSEYFVNPVTAIMNMSDWLSDDGELIISFHFIYPEHKPEGTDMLRYTDNWIRKVLGHYGFKTIDITSRIATRGKTLLDSFYMTESMKAFKDTEVIGSLVRARKK